MEFSSYMKSSQPVKVFKFTPLAFACIFRQGEEVRFKVSADGIPKDGQIVGAGYDHTDGTFWMQIRSESFEQVLDGCQFPIANPPVLTALNT